MDDSSIIQTVFDYIKSCVPEVGTAEIVDHSVVRFPQGVTHFSPGSYQYMPKVTTPISNVFMSGDWIVTR